MPDLNGPPVLGDAPSMLSIDEALARISGLLQPVGVETIPLDESVGRICAVQAAARLDVPPFPVAAMDGYAVRWADIAQTLNGLSCIGTVKAGDREGHPLASGTCVRIFTGAPVPPGADTVVMQEQAFASEGLVRILSGAEAYRHIRSTGCNIRNGDLAVRSERRLTARDIGLLAGAGYATVVVYRQPRIAVLSTGDELSEFFGVGDGAQILDANRPALKALVRAWGGVPIDLGIAADDAEALVHAIDETQADLLVVSGGASVGTFDLVYPTLERLGLKAAFRKVSMKPGKATMFGLVGGTPILSLPGNAGAALVSALMFLKPALSVLAGLGFCKALREPAVLAAPLAAVGPRDTFLRGRLGQGPDGATTFAALASQDSAMLSGLAEADGLVVRRASEPPALSGTVVEIIRFARIAGF